MGKGILFRLFLNSANTAPSPPLLSPAKCTHYGFWGVPTEDRGPQRAQGMGGCGKRERAALTKKLMSGSPTLPEVKGGGAEEQVTTQSHTATAQDS